MDGKDIRDLPGFIPDHNHHQPHSVGELTFGRAVRRLLLMVLYLFLLSSPHAPFTDCLASETKCLRWHSRR